MKLRNSWAQFYLKAYQSFLLLVSVVAYRNSCYTIYHHPPTGKKWGWGNLPPKQEHELGFPTKSMVHWFQLSAKSLKRTVHALFFFFRGESLTWACVSEVKLICVWVGRVYHWMLFLSELSFLPLNSPFLRKCL